MNVWATHGPERSRVNFRSGSLTTLKTRMGTGLSSSAPGEIRTHDLRLRSPLLRLRQVDTDGCGRVFFAGGERVFGDAYARANSDVWATSGPEGTGPRGREQARATRGVMTPFIAPVLSVLVGPDR